MFKNKFITTIITATALTFMLTACGDEEAPRPEPTSTSTDDGTVKPPVVPDYDAGDIIDPEHIEYLEDVYSVTLGNEALIAVDPTQPLPQEVIDFVRENVAADYEALKASGLIGAVDFMSMTPEQQDLLIQQFGKADDIAQGVSGAVEDMKTGDVIRKEVIVITPGYGTVSDAVDEERYDTLYTAHIGGGLNFPIGVNVNYTEQGLIDQVNAWIATQENPESFEIIPWTL